MARRARGGTAAGGNGTASWDGGGGVWDDYHLVGVVGCALNVTLAVVCLWRICVHHGLLSDVGGNQAANRRQGAAPREGPSTPLRRGADPPPNTRATESRGSDADASQQARVEQAGNLASCCTCTSKRVFHWCLLVHSCCAIPLYAGIVAAGEFNLTEYVSHSWGTVLQSTALAIVVKEWAYVMQSLQRWHVSSSAGGAAGRTPAGGPGGAAGSWARCGARMLNCDCLASEQRVTLLLVVYITFFMMVAATATGIAFASYDAFNSSETQRFIDSAPHEAYIMLETIWDASLVCLFLGYGLSVRQKLVRLAPTVRLGPQRHKRPKNRLRSTLLRINIVMFICASCDFLRIGLHTRSLFGSKADPQWIGVFTYFLLNEWVGRIVPACVLLMLMRNPGTHRSSSRRGASHEVDGPAVVGGEHTGVHAPPGSPAQRPRWASSTSPMRSPNRHDWRGSPRSKPRGVSPKASRVGYGALASGPTHAGPIAPSSSV